MDCIATQVRPQPVKVGAAGVKAAIPLTTVANNSAFEDGEMEAVAYEVAFTLEFEVTRLDATIGPPKLP
jgi:hypothetical protein